MSGLTAAQLHARYGERLDLRWVAGRKGGGRRLEAVPGDALVGHFNPLHPHAVEVLDAAALGALEAMAPEHREEYLERLLAPDRLAVLVCGEASPELAARAEALGVPLMASRRPAPSLIHHLRFHLEQALAPAATVHGVFLEVLGLGVLLTGEAGIGKSELALELINRGHRLVADDAPEFRRVAPETLRGRCPEMLQDFLEVRGLGLLDVRALFGDNAVKRTKDLHLVAHLCPMEELERDPRMRLEGGFRTRRILDVEVTEVCLPVAPGRNLAVLVETATRQYDLRRRGYNPLTEMQRRQEALRAREEGGP